MEEINRIPTEERLRVIKLPYKLPQKLAEIIDGFKSDMKLTLIFKLKFYQGEK